ncbi:MAG: AzlC family ABC transporter permease [Desulfovibrio sp.]|jgi:4-azaleucine resistance transporter AzlC|nr:AzlC family ABC transporter permease [Desulfovibrio sp.]
MSTEKDFTLKNFLRGARLSLPILLGYLPVGFAFGVLAVQAGMEPLTAGLMCYFVYAGSAQLIAAGLLANGASVATVVITTFIVNLRHLLMSAALAPYLKHWSKTRQAWFCFEMTDETFAANLSRFSSCGVNAGEAFGLNFFSHGAWTAGGILGAFSDSAIGYMTYAGLDFALPGMFIALLLPHFRLPRRLFAAGLGAALSLLFITMGIDQWNILAATVCSATLAAFWPVNKRRNDVRA